MPTSSPLRWFGGKGRLAARIVPLFGVHDHYVEVFAGSAAVLFAKERSRLETVNDLDGDVVNLFSVLRDPDTAARLASAVALTPYSRAEFTAARAALADGEQDPVERARLFVVAVNQSQAKSPHRSGWSAAVARTGGSPPALKWSRLPAQITAAAERLVGVQVERDDWERVLDRYDRPTSLLYLDPPYLPEVRRGGVYRHELSMLDHERLVDRVLAASAQVVLSGYANPVYDRLVDAGWDVVTFTTSANRSAAHDVARVEVLWRNPAAVAARPVAAGQLPGTV